MTTSIHPSLDPSAAADLQLKLQTKRTELHRLNGHDFTDEVARHFPKGSVGGSGRRVQSLNTRREQAIERKISTASRAAELQKEIAGLEHLLTHGRTVTRPPAARTSKPGSRHKVIRKWNSVSERTYTIWRWYMFGKSEHQPPYDDISEGEIERIAGMSMPGMDPHEPDWVAKVRERYPS